MALERYAMLCIERSLWPDHLAQTRTRYGLDEAGEQDIDRRFKDHFAEQPSAIGLQANGHLVEVFVSNDGASWTIVVTRPDGWSCIVAVGEHWESLPGPVTGPLA